MLPSQTPRLTISIPVQSAKQFFQEYLQERAEITRRSAQEFTAFRQRFYIEDCPLGRLRAKKLDKLLREEERIVAVHSSKSAAEVVTTTSGGEGPSARQRYRLILTHGKWLLQDVDLECPSCHGSTGDTRCPICDGKGWWPYLKSALSDQGAPSGERKKSSPPARWRFL